MTEVPATRNGEYNQQVKNVAADDSSQGDVGVPFTALITDAANSGRLVPMATIVKPTINSDTPSEVQY